MKRASKKSFWIRVSAVVFFSYLLVCAYVLFSLSLPSLKEGVDELRLAQALLLADPRNAAAHFDKAGERFEFSSAQLTNAPFIFKVMAPLPPFRWQVQLLKSTHALAGAGKITSSLAATFPPLLSPDDKNINAILTHGSAVYFSYFNSHQAELSQLQSQLQVADTELQQIPPGIALAGRHTLEDLQRRVHEANKLLPVAFRVSTSLQGAFGGNDTAPHTFLVLFQNNAELRPSGGFLGSYATLTASSGRIRSFAFGQNIYTLDKLLPTPREKPPLSLQSITTHWDFQDSNIGTGFLADSTDSVAAFYKEATHAPVDGCIYIDTSVLEDLLALTGPLALPDADHTIVDSNSVRLALTNEVEKKYFQNADNQAANQPKQIIADLMPLLVAKVMATPGALGKMSGLLAQDIHDKSIQISSPHTVLKPILEALLPGDAPPPSGNWLKIINTNIGGQKSSLNVWQDVRIRQDASPSSAKTTEDVTITRQHRGTGVWPDADNRNFMEAYIPSNAEVVSLPRTIGGDSQLSALDQANYPPVSADFYPTVTQGETWKRISWWGTTAVGKTTSYHFSYAIPSTPQNNGYFTYIKQAGSRHETIQALSFKGEVDGNLFLTK
jgi:hypothetical protein